MIDFLMKLISFDTTKIENDAMLFIENYVSNLYGNKLQYERQDIGDKNRYNLIIKNTDTPDIILAGHVDVVPEFSQEQFVPRIEDNKLYGRGAIDMKSGVAINIALIDFMLKKNVKFWILCYCDEEYHFLGMRKFTQKYGGKILPKLTIVTESTDNKIYTGFRGIASIELEIKGKSTHSARKYLGINAISEYVILVDALEKYIQTRDSDGYVSLTNLAGINGGIYNKNGKIVFQDNIVPDISKGVFSIRLGNDFSVQDLDEFIKKYFIERGIKLVNKKIKLWCHPLIQDGLEEKYGKYGVIEKGYTFGYSDIQFIKEYIGGDCLIIGPSPNNQSHQADEYVDIDSIFNAKEVIENILLDI